MPIAKYDVPRISDDSPAEMKRSLERSQEDVSSAIQVLQDGVDNYYTVHRFENVTAFKKILVHTTHWSSFNGLGVEEELNPYPLPAMSASANAAVYTWYVEPIPERLVVSSYADDNGQWVLLYELDAVDLVP
jgi:hypothetical protein